VVEANLLPPDPQIITITTDDNFTLTGYYYPAGVENAPVVVLMHWMMGDRNDWNEVAVWLQNRGLKNPFENPGDPAQFRWWDPSWFPVLAADKSYAVLTFSFRGCQPFKAGCQSIQKDNWIKDAQAVMRFARGLDGVDANRIAAIGSSIGADGAADACQLLNVEFPGACKGALSLSPGDYLDVSYVNTIQQLGASNPPTPAWCVADPSEFAICQSAEASGNSAYQDFSITDGDHGNMLLSPDLDPLPMQLILDFLDEVLTDEN
jgi:dienelactone hydrolase